MFFRVSFGERLKNEEVNKVEESGSRGNREMTFVVGKVCFRKLNKTESQRD